MWGWVVAVLFLVVAGAGAATYLSYRKHKTYYIPGDEDE